MNEYILAAAGDMTVQQFLNGVLYVGAIVGAVGAIGGAFHFAVVRPLRLFLRREVVSVLNEIKDSVDASTREVQEKVDELKGEFADHITNGHP